MQLSGALFYSFAISRSLESASGSPDSRFGLLKSWTVQFAEWSENEQSAAYVVVAGFISYGELFNS